MVFQQYTIFVEPRGSCLFCPDISCHKNERYIHETNFCRLIDITGVNQCFLATLF